MPSSLAVEAEDEVLFGPGDVGFLRRITDLAASYPYQHSIFGSPATAAYVRKLASDSQNSGEGWYGVARGPDNLAVIHLTVYGVGNGEDHTLFKLRHPLLTGDQGGECLTRAIELAARTAAELRPGSQKLVLFLGEEEDEALRAAKGAGFLLEGVVTDYYRLGERCFLLGRTATGAL